MIDPKKTAHAMYELWELLEVKTREVAAMEVRLELYRAQIRVLQTEITRLRVLTADTWGGRTG